MSGYVRKNEKYPALPIEHVVNNKGLFGMTLAAEFKYDCPEGNKFSGV